ncbi:MAG: aminotransferase class III-fold pyridoxal phosphate-dependent enzyme [Anaerolineae bacterium]|nr:aminotransferase class III-fold pyridoxal phosphate-dependent enzyme [Anaerolineae bacterium]
MAKVRTTIYESYWERFPRSRELAEEAGQVIPRRVTHDARHMLPFPLYMSHALGSHKWDVDGNEYIDYAGGHGSLLLGHSHPDIVRAVQAQVERGTHLGFCHEKELRWAGLVTELVPCADRAEFTMSGTESVMLALRIARAYTGRERIIKFQDHFHGWYDQVYHALSVPFDAPASQGIAPSCLEPVTVLPPNDILPVQAELARGDVAAVILEPSGARAGRLPVDRRYLAQLREETERNGVVLIFDEVITGFRYRPGGAQEYYGVTPDLATFGKIVGGGLPAGAVGGKAEIMAVLEYGRQGRVGGPSRVAHTGTYNANPLAAAAGVTMLEHVSTGLPTARASEIGAAIRSELNAVLARTGVSGCIYGDCSIVHFLLAPPDRCPPLTEDGLIPPDFPLTRLLEGKSEMTGHLKRALLLEGVDILGDHAWVSAAHDEDDVEETARAFERAIGRLLVEDLVAKR